MPSVSPNRGRNKPGRPSSAPPVRDLDFNRALSSKSATTSARAAVDLTQLQGNAMNVYIRVRPFTDRELSFPGSINSTVRVDAENPCMITLLDPSKDFRPRETFSFSKCFWSVLERSGSSTKAPGEIRDCIDNFLLNNRSNHVSSPRVHSPRTVSSLNNTVVSARGRVADNASPAFEGAGSNPVVVSLNNISQTPYCSQEHVYNAVGRPILENTFEGYNGCVFAYGQTGSGKTFTMLGYMPKPSAFNSAGSRQCLADGMDEYDCENSKRSIMLASPARFRRASAISSQCSRQDTFTRQASPQTFPHTNSHTALDMLDATQMDPDELQGIIPRITSDLFKGLGEQRERDPSHSYRLEVEYYEIYNEKVYDLIRSTKDADLKIRQHPVTGPYVEGLASRVVTKEEQIAAIIRKGSIDRHTAATKINDWSSRSHAILTINVLQLYLDENDNTCKKESKLNLVDLAGSERTGAVGAEGKQFLEGTKINLSLTTLGRVIDCLADLSQAKTLLVPVPYRDSNLTWLLMDSLGGNSKTSMIATISPHAINYEEMRQTIRYASRARQIVNKAVINEDPQIRQIRLLTGEVDRLRKVLREAGHNEFSRDYVLELQRRNSFLEKLLEEKEKVIAELRAELENHGISVRAQESVPVPAPLPVPNSTKRQRGSVATTGTKINSYTPSSGDSSVIQKPPVADAKNELYGVVLPSTENRLMGPVSQSELVELHNRIKALTRETERLRGTDAKKKRLAERFLSSRMNWIFEIIIQTMRQKEDEIIRQTGYLIGAKKEQSSKNIRLIQKGHREELEKLRVSHSKEMEELHNISKARIKESIEECNEQFQQLIGKHMEKLSYVEKRMKVYKEFYDTAQKQMESEKEKMRVSHEEQLKRERARFQDDLNSLRNQIGIGANDSRRATEKIKRMQEEHDRAMARLQEELDRALSAKDQEVSQLKQSLANESMRRETDLLEKDKLRRHIEQELSDLRRKLQKGQMEWSRAEQQKQNELERLAQEQERLVELSNNLLLELDSKSPGVESTVSQIRSLLNTRDQNPRGRTRDPEVHERKDYTAELEAVEERKRRDTKMLRDIVQQLKQTQEDSKATLQRFEQDMMKCLADATRPREQSDGKTTPTTTSSNARSVVTSKLNSTNSSETQGIPTKKTLARKTLKK